MRRYLMRLGYCGTRLRGIQKQLEELEEECSSVQGLLERGLNRLHQTTISQLYFSSRTDKGVHAVCNTAHVDLLSLNDTLIEPSSVTNKLNYFFKTINVDIRVHNTSLVPLAFHARYDAKARRYLYRLAVIPEPPEPGRLVQEQYMPIAEIDKLYLVRPPFDAESLEPVCRLLEGVHDFASFGNAPSKSDYKKETVRELHSITVSPGRPSLDPSYDPLYSQLQFWDVNIRASGFVYRQVRRTVGVLVGVAQGRLTLQDVQHMLDHPSHGNWRSQAVVAPPEGLFLLDVEYPPEVFVEEEKEGDAELPPDNCER